MTEIEGIIRIMNDPRNGDALVFNQLAPVTLAAIDRCTDTSALDRLRKAVRRCHSAANKALFMDAPFG